jgi:hypothetical protein
MLLAFSGLKGSGKDTAAAILVDEYSFTKLAFADALREMLLIIDPYVPVTTGQMWDYTDKIVTHMPLSHVIDEFGWDTAKREMPEVRRLMQVIGTEAGRMIFGTNVWVDLLTKRFPDIADDEVRYVITDCRFDNEVEFVRNNGGTVVWIDRPGLSSDGHASESTHIKDLASTIVYNDETQEEFEEDIRFMLFLRGVSKVDNSSITY